jgi:hypothetical protein
MNEDPEEGRSQIVVFFRGELAPDFTVTGESMFIIRPVFFAEPHRMPLAFKLEVLDPLTGDEALTLRSLVEQANPFQGAVLRYEGPLPQVIVP